MIKYGIILKRELSYLFQKININIDNYSKRGENK